MRRSALLASLVAGALGLVAVGCGTTKPPPAAEASPTPAAQPSQVVAAPANSAAGSSPAAAVPTAAPIGKAPAQPAPGKPPVEPTKPSAAPAPAIVVTKEPAPAPPAAAATKPPAPSAAPVAEPVKTAEAAAPVAPAHTKVGPEKCMMCHRIQYTSWNESKHKAKGLDCEGCHGNGADYKAIAVMKDRPAAVKAGLVLPGLGSCKKCHVKADASMLPLVHAHKAK